MNRVPENSCHMNWVTDIRSFLNGVAVKYFMIALPVSKYYINTVPISEYFINGVRKIASMLKRVHVSRSPMNEVPVISLFLDWVYLEAGPATQFSKSGSLNTAYF